MDTSLGCPSEVDPLECPYEGVVPYCRLPNADNVKLESRAWRIERQSLSGMACASVQSWLLQFLAKKLEVLDSYIKENFAEEYENVLAATGCSVLPKVSLLCQDAALDQLDLWARAAANAKSQRRLLWLQPSCWSKQLKDQVMRFPVESGLVCGSRLLETLEEFKDFDEALDRVETHSARQPAKTSQHMTKQPHNPPSKKPRLSETNSSDNSQYRNRNYSNRGSYRGSSRGYKASAAAGSRDYSQGNKNQQSKKDWGSFPKSWEQNQKSK